MTLIDIGVLLAGVLLLLGIGSSKLSFRLGMPVLDLAPARSFPGAY